MLYRKKVMPSRKCIERKLMVNMLIFLFLFFTQSSTYYYVEVDISSLLLDVEIIKQEEREKLGPN